MISYQAYELSLHETIIRKIINSHPYISFGSFSVTAGSCKHQAKRRAKKQLLAGKKRRLGGGEAAPVYTSNNVDRTGGSETESCVITRRGRCIYAE